MVKLQPFCEADFDTFISWIDNEKLLITIAGNYFTFPLTQGQLNNYLADKNSIAFSIVTTTENRVTGHAEIIIVNENLCKIDKLIIGASNRGKGIGSLVIKQLLDYCFTQLYAGAVELNVFEWNSSAIKCYLLAGFVDTGKRMQMQVHNETWTALNMIKHKNNIYEK